MLESKEEAKEVRNNFEKVMGVTPADSVIEFLPHFQYFLFITCEVWIDRPLSLVVLLQILTQLIEVEVGKLLKFFLDLVVFPLSLLL